MGMDGVAAREALEFGMAHALGEEPPACATPCASSSSERNSGEVMGRLSLRNGPAAALRLGQAL